MNAAKAYRKLKEVEEKKLANRITLLKLELQKSLHKIEETRKRTNTILHHRNKIDERNKQKDDELMRRQREIEAAQAINHNIRIRMAEYRQANLASVHMSKAEDARKIMQEHLNNKKLIQEQRKLELLRAVELRKLIQTQYMEGRLSREYVLEKKKDDARHAFNEKVMDEEKRTKDFERKVASMEAEEVKLIMMLEQAQEEQRKAYADLEEALLKAKQEELEREQETMDGTSDRSMRTSSR